MLRAREALVAARTELINATRGPVKSMGTGLPKCSSPSFEQKVKDAIPEKVREAQESGRGPLFGISAEAMLHHYEVNGLSNV